MKQKPSLSKTADELVGIIMSYPCKSAEEPDYIADDNCDDCPYYCGKCRQTQLIEKVLLLEER